MSKAGRLHAAVVCLIALAIGIGELPLFVAAADAPAGKTAAPAKSPAPARPAARSGTSRTPTARTNPHVHLPAAKSSGKTATAKKKISKPLTSKGRTHHSRSRTHHLSGVVTGVIRDSHGSTVSAARVRLVTGWRRHGRTRHFAISSAGGHYAFRGVRPGRYRVFASRTGSGSGHAKFAIRGGVRHVDVKLGTGGGKKKKHRKR